MSKRCGGTHYALRITYYVAAVWLGVAVAAVYGEEPKQSRGLARPLRFVTFNLYHGGPFSGLNGDARDLDFRLEAVVEELRSLDVDVVGLQEASTGRSRGNVAERLAAGLGFHAAYAPANPRIFGNGWFSRAAAALLDFAEGPAIVSRFPVLEWAVQELPACGRVFERRTVLSATLDTPWGAMRVHSTHTLGELCQTQRVAEIAQQHLGPLPGVLMGDFNAVEDSPAMSVFMAQAAFVDAYRAANPGLPGFTVWQRIAEPAPTVRRRVDYLFVVRSDAEQSRVLSSRVILNTPRPLPDCTQLWPSDHYGVLAEIDVSTESVAASSAP